MFADAEQSAGVDTHPGGRGEASRRKRGQVKRDGKEIPERGRHRDGRQCGSQEDPQGSRLQLCGMLQKMSLMKY